MFEKTNNFDYSEEWEKEILEQKEKLERLEQIEYIEDKLRSKNAAKQYKKWLNIYQGEIA